MVDAAPHAPPPTPPWAPSHTKCKFDAVDLKYLLKIVDVEEHIYILLQRLDGVLRPPPTPPSPLHTQNDNFDGVDLIYLLLY